VCDVRSAPLRRTASELAKYSYGIYLVHVPSLAVIAKLRPDTPQPLQVAIYLTLVTTFSVAGYHLVERPGIRLGGRLADRWQRWYVRHVARRDALPAAGDAAALNVAR
jgi:peptidoglycan/LPS O-acetylase OafA/YrhL